MTALMLRRSTAEGADYRIGLSRREATLQPAWTVFGRRMVGLRLALGVAVGKPVLTFARPLIDFGLDLFAQDPIRLPGVSVSADASIGLVVRTGPVRFGPQLLFSTTWLPRAGGYTVNVDVPYTTSDRLRAAGLGFRIEVHPDPRVSLSLETHVYVHQGLPGASLRLGLGAAWPAG